MEMSDKQLILIMQYCGEIFQREEETCRVGQGGEEFALPSSPLLGLNVIDRS